MRARPRTAPWTAADMPRLDGRVAVVTGANSGLGLVCARALAGAGATVVLACRDLDRAQVAAAGLGAGALVERLDLASLESVRECAARVADRFPALDLLINNAGVMAPPRRVTTDGFESQFGVNHLGHFALTGLLLPSLLAASSGGARVVTVSSEMHRVGRIAFDDLQGERKYARWAAYGQSKLANLLFCFELARRCEGSGLGLLSLAAHPGYSATNLQFAGPPAHEAAIMRVTNRLIAQSAAMGALPTLYGATAPGVGNGWYIGPGGFGGMRGYPRVCRAVPRAHDVGTMRRLWAVSEELTGVRFGLPGDG